MELLKKSSSNLNKIDTLLFDLDETLVHMERKFRLIFMLKGMVRLSHVIWPWKFSKAFWAAINKIRENETDRTNHEVFIHSLLEQSRSSKEDLENTLNRVLIHDFPQSRKYFHPIENARQTVQRAKSLGYRLILATNPVFPLKAVEMRLEFGGLKAADFEFITHSQNMTRCKPNISYYEEIVSKLNLTAKYCMMIGDDPTNDLPAAALGISVFLLETSKLCKKTQKHHSHPFILGSHADLSNLLFTSSQRA